VWSQARCRAPRTRREEPLWLRTVNVQIRCTFGREDVMRSMVIKGCISCLFLPSKGLPIKGAPHQRGSPSKGLLIKGAPHQRGSPSKGYSIKGAPHQRGFPSNGHPITRNFRCASNRGTHVLSRFVGLSRVKLLRHSTTAPALKQLQGLSAAAWHVSHLDSWTSMRGEREGVPRKEGKQLSDSLSQF
jgi:hypothetical protein